jgi:tetratricopeptide (TPR) repeat protein
MDPWTIIVGLGVLVGIIAGFVQILDYLQKRREKSIAASSLAQHNSQLVLPHAPTAGDSSVASVLEVHRLIRLRQILTERFDEGELHTLCFDLGVDYDNLPGQSKADKARELVEHLERHGRVSNLVETGKKLRSDIARESLGDKDAYAPPELPHALPEDRIPHNLPRRSEFVGREAEKAQVHEALLSRSYLVSIDGIGGIGKSSLALEVVYECLNASKNKEHGDGIAIFSGLIWTTAKDRDLSLNALLDTISLTLNYPGIAQQPLKEKQISVHKLLQARSYLLIVDNFETITDVGIRDFLLNLPEPSKTLITTREQKLRQARAISLKGLAEPEAFALIRSEGKRLGLVSLEEAEDRVLLRLYVATGGAPLAIKWAVGQIKQKGQSLDTVLAVLHEARGDIFEQVFARSWGLLSPEARQVLLVMPLFATSATRAALEATSDLHHFTLDESLGQLVEMSLVDATDELELARRRYNIHPLVRAFAAAKLRQDVEQEDTAQLRMAKFYEAFTGEHGGDWYQQGYSRLDPELPNVLTAVERCWKQRNIALGTTIFRNVTGFMNIRGYYNDALSMGQRAIALAAEIGDDLTAAKLKVWPVSWVYRHRDKLDAAEEHINPALAVFERTGASKDTAYAKRSLGLIARARGDLERASQLLEESTAIYEIAGDPEGLYMAKNHLAGLELLRGNLDKAWALSDSALKYGSQHGFLESAAWRVLGGVAYRRGDWERAKFYWEQSLTQFRQINYMDGIADTLVNLARVEADMKHQQPARQMVCEALDIYRRLGTESTVRQAEELLAKLSESGDQGNQEDRTQPHNE